MWSCSTESIDVAGLALLELASLFFELGQESFHLAGVTPSGFKEDHVLNLRTLTKRVFNSIKLFVDSRERERTRPSRSGCNAPAAALTSDRSEHRSCRRRWSRHQSASIRRGFRKETRHDRRDALRSHTVRRQYDFARAQQFVRRHRNPATIAFVIERVRSFVIARDSLEDVDERDRLVRQQDGWRTEYLSRTSMYSTARFTASSLR